MHTRPTHLFTTAQTRHHTVDGNVTLADDSGRVKGRAEIAFRFDRLTTGGDRYDMQTAAVSRMAPATKGEDATKIGTGVVLATNGKEMRLAPGADVSTTLTAPLTVRIRS